MTKHHIFHIFRNIKILISLAAEFVDGIPEDGEQTVIMSGYTGCGRVSAE